MLNLWGRIVSELAHLQDTAGPASPGSVVNPISGRPYIVDTCCAAAVFAAEYQRTVDPQWQRRAEEALSAARSGKPFRGVSEPAWDVLGWHDVPESLPATGIAIDAYCDASARLGLELGQDQTEDLVSFLLSCRIGKNGFAHNALSPEQEASEVQNANASVLNMLGRIARAGHPRSAGLTTTSTRLARGQLGSGFWPYHYPGRKLKVREMLKRRPLSSLFAPGRFDSYHGYGDITHHLMTLYFAAGYVASSEPSSLAGVLGSGWRWIRGHLVTDSDGSLAIDWSEDPFPTSPQYSNARDTNAYFLLLGALPRLVAVGVVDRDDASTLIAGLLAHIEAKLMSQRDQRPCVTPCEGSPDLVRNILPMFEQSAAWKGRLIADVVLGAGLTGAT